MRAKELWDARWRVAILNPIGWMLALTFPFLFRLIQNAPKNIPAAVVPLMHYPNMAFGWFGEDLPELLLVYVVVWALGQITREWQTGSIEFLGQLPLTSRQIAWTKGLWGSAEIAVVSLLSTAVLWIGSVANGHHLPGGTLVVSALVITIGFIAILWLMSAFAWAFHSTYAVILIGIGVYFVSVITRSVAALRSLSPLTYISNTSPSASMATLWLHFGILLAATVVLVWVALGVAAHQEFIPNRGRDQL